MQKPVGLILLAFIVLFGNACSKAETTEATITADFDFSFTNDNTVRFTNTTVQEVSVVRWDFGNGAPLGEENEAEAFYPVKGDYEVRLDVWKSGVQGTKIKTVTITKNAFELNLEAKVNADRPNYVTFTCNPDLDAVEWDFPTRGSSAKKEVTVYYPFSGTYKANFKATINGTALTEEVSVQIAQNDADYVSNFELTWQDEFDGAAVDQDKWLFETGQHGWGNAELQNYTNGPNSTVKDGLLSITAKKTGTGQKVGDYSSSRMNSKKSFQYGRIEFRAKMPELKGPGVWPALWLLSDDIKTGVPWPACGEIDMMEYVSHTPEVVFFTIHTEAYNHTKGNSKGSGNMSLPTIATEFHNYGMIWTERKLVFYLDDVTNVKFTYDRPSVYNNANWPFDKPYYAIMNIAVGGMFGGIKGVDDSIFPQTMEVDYMRVYQHPDMEIQ